MTYKLTLMNVDRETAADILFHPLDGQEPTHLVSIYSTPPPFNPSAHNIKPVDGFEGFKGKKLALQFDDVCKIQHGYIAPNMKDGEAIVKFGEELKKDLEAGPCTLLVHCDQGVSRSTATSFVILCTALGEGKETEALDMVVAAQPKAFPNQRIVEIGDKLLKRRDRMVEVNHIYLCGMKSSQYGW